MNKNLIFAFAAGALMLASCNKKSEPQAIYNYTFPTYNYVVDFNDNNKVSIVPSLYQYQMDLIAGTLKLTSALSLGDATVNFTTDDMKFEAYYPMYEDEYYEIIKYKSLLAGTTNNSLPVQDLTGELCSLSYYPSSIPGIDDPTSPYGRSIKMSYNLGNRYNVRTFWSDMTFKGVTSTSYPSTGGGTATFSNNDVLYRVVMNFKENKATIIFYNVKLAETMPAITNIVLKDLPVTLNSYGYTISGKDVVPEVYEGGKGVPNTKYVFNEIEFASSGDFTSADCTYKVAGVFNGYFRGKYLLTSDDMKSED